MTSKFSKFIAATAIVGVLAAVPLATATPAAANGWGYRGYHHGGGYGGWGQPGGGYGGGGGHHHDHGGAWAGVAAAGLLGALAVGAIANSARQPYYDSYQQPAYYPHQTYRSCYPVNQPVTDDWGNVLYYQRTQVCD